MQWESTTLNKLFWVSLPGGEQRCWWSALVGCWGSEEDARASLTSDGVLAAELLFPC